MAQIRGKKEERCIDLPVGLKENNRENRRCFNLQWECTHQGEISSPVRSSVMMSLTISVGLSGRRS
jgi:hypothetical protein